VTDLQGVFVSVTLLAAATSTLVAVLALRRRHVPGAAAFSAMMFAGALWCAMYAGELLSATQYGQELWAQAAYFGIVLIPPCWLLFCLGYTGMLRDKSKARAALLFVVPAVTFAFALLGVSGGLIWTEARLAHVHGMDVLLVTYGPWFWVHTSFSYACLLTGAVILLATVLTEVKPLTGQGVLLVLAVVLPWVANIITLYVTQPRAGLDLTPPSIVLSGALVALGLSRFGALRVFPGIVPAARDAVMQGMRDGVMVVGRDGVILNANHAAEVFFNVSKGELAGHHVTQFVGDLPRLRGISDASAVPVREFSFETAIPSPDGDQRFTEIVVSPLAGNPSSPGLVMAMRDVTERRRLQDELEHRALHDELTALPNRALLREHLKELLALQKRGGAGIALLMLDLDRFKEINDTFGHGAGDQVLRTMAERLRAGIRESDLVARLGGDEFAVVLPACDGERAAAVAAGLRERITESLMVDHRHVSVGASVGIAIGPDHGEEEGVLMQHADVALYMAKESAQGVAVYEPGLDPNSPDRLELLDAVRNAVERCELAMHYQPVVHTLSGDMARVEALVRWPRPGGEVIEARDFIPLAERCGVLTDVTTWVLDEVLHQCGVWEEAGWRVDVAVNLSATDLQDPDLVGRVTAALSRAGIDAERLWVEITETSIMVNPERAREVLEALRGIAVQVSIDDFGVGHSSLAYVRTLPAVELKIDRSFVRGAATHPEDRAIVRAAVALGHDLGLTVTGEGAEDRETLDRVTELGCDCVQGHYIARPMPADDLLAWVRGRQSEQTAGPAPAQADRLADQ
jgi:diguanylate cyclase (GGDEF)-like protein/PAS domain S-box-containing protein